MEKFVKMTEIVEEKTEFAPAIQVEIVAVVAATMVQTIKMVPEEIEFFVPLETIEVVEAIEAALEAQQIPAVSQLLEVFMELAPAFTSFMTPPSKLVKAFQEFIEEEQE
jgi:hypothetical protein